MARAWLPGTAGARRASEAHARKSSGAARRLKLGRGAAPAQARAAGNPDIAGIVPGPQANPWGDEPGAADDDEADAEDEAKS
jgi:hypothetical protein